jgi:hypothetical protein
LRQDPTRSAGLIAEALRTAGDLPGEHHHGLVLAAAAIAHSAVLPLLVKIADRPIRQTDSWGLREADSTLRLTAVDGIEAIADDEREAVDALMALTRSPDRAVQAAAVDALTRSAFGADRVARLRTSLPEDRRFLLEVRRAQIEDVPQISNPTRHLAGTPRSRDERPAPDASSRPAGPANRHTPPVSKGA